MFRVGAAFDLLIAVGRISIALRATVALALLLLASFASPAAAAAAGCSNPSPGVTVCVGNQSAGLDNSDVFPNTTTLTVNNLTADVGTTASPSKGISLTNDLATSGKGDPASNSSPITINFDDSHKVVTTTAAGVFGQSIGESSGDGCDLCGTAKAAGAGASVTIVTQGPISSAGHAGVLGQSLGGNGGNGGTAQDGGTGGASSAVNITVQNSIGTTGANAPGIAALSRAGNGGIGDTTLVSSHGGGGASAGQVTINTTATGTIETQGDSSAGILGQSIGGAGGAEKSGFSINGAQAGSGAGIAQTVTIGTLASITTHGNFSVGILAQSIGGGGGGGGFGTILFATAGGNGGSGGPGGDVQITTGAGTTIATGGTQSSAIYAQSIGGGGGAGSHGFGLFSDSGDGSPGGHGGNVTVTNNATLIATNDQSSGIYAQSIGGGGGSGGASGGLVSFGGRGGSGQDAGTVDVHNFGAITVSGHGDFSNNSNSTLSAGIFAQSVGGGGGDGGYSGGIATFGGTGGSAGVGKAVTVENTGKILANCGGTCGGGDGIFAQSVGGGGGNGGGSGGVVSFGGNGHGGGDGGPVTVTNSGAGITTTAQFSSGIFAQSIGGGGGNGNFSGGIAAIGGSGGVGGNGLAVTVNNTANISTGGDDSYGIFAQSVGGGGGNGGGAVGGGAFAAFALGGDGGAGGGGGAVCVNTNLAGPCSNAQTIVPTIIQTKGDRSTGILAQSVGGGGGNGGFAIAASVGLIADVNIGKGGVADNGGVAGAVFVAGAGTITTGQLGGGPNNRNLGQFSDGIDAESIGGGGGNGGFSIGVAASTGAAVSLNIGGSGGKGNHAGQVTVNTQETITTWGDQAVGIFARSIGGGGGNGGFAIGGSASPYASVGLTFGGSGADGGYGDQVHVDNVGSITTHGDQANGITAQSIGGGGGNGGFTVSGSFALSGAGVSLAFGGNAGGGGTGGIVHVANQGDITTSGVGSIGILAQSIGGGGGNGGFSGDIAISGGGAFGNAMGGGGGTGNFANAVDVTSTGKITTQQDNAIGIEAQSIGGGGGNGGFAISVQGALDASAIGSGKGGVAGSGGYAGTVTVVSNGEIETHGKLAYGILAQSIGGGGGNGGFAITANLSESGGANGNSVGGNGGTGNFASAVMVTTCPTVACNTPGTVISTTGQGATGILAQSIGGGGGNGGFVIDLNLSIDGNAGGKNSFGGTDIGGLAGSGGTASKGGTVTVNSNGTIMTTGEAASGIVAQSIGGGGGSGGFAISLGFSDGGNATSNALGGSGGSGGNGDVVTVNSKGDIHTTGNTSSGIIAQSIGGGGGNGGFTIGATVSLSGSSTTNSLGGTGGAGGSGMEVDVTNTKAITIEGSHASGIVAQSIGGGGGNGGFSIGAGVTTGSGSDSTDSIGGGGGTGGNGGNGGIVSVKNLVGSSIVTGILNTPLNTSTGFMDNGIIAQSIGGGGGNGGFTISAGFSTEGDTKTSIGGSGPCDAACQAAAPGAGGGGGTANTVTVENAGIIVTNGANSNGILAQSIGGGGGSGGFAISAGFSTQAGAATNAIGGSGGGGGNADAVKVTQDANAFIFINNVNSTGILAQSIGGGGGNGGFAIGLDGTVSKSNSASNTLGGSGGVGGNGGTVNVTTLAGSLILTSGANDRGIVAQSIGGGGGNGGFTIGGDFSTSGGAGAQSSIGGSQVGATGGGGGIAQTVTVDNAGTVITGGVNSVGITAQAIGGGGGNGGFTATAGFSISGAAAANSVGGTGGNGGTGGVVNVTQEATAAVSVTAANSIGILAQSVGGGGGNGGFTLAGAGNVSSSKSASNSVGGTGGTASDGNTVTVTTLAGSSVSTGNVDSHGIVAQSIGGGGGNGGFSVAAGFSTDGGAATNSVGGAGTDGGKGGLVIVDNAGSVTTKGMNSIGITAQSIGGGGGNGGFSGGGDFSLSGPSASNSVGGAGANGGDGGTVLVFQEATAKVDVQRSGSIGILAQAIGGGGGNGGFSIGAGGSIDANAASNSVGGNGGKGGKGGVVEVTTLAGSTITTNGMNDFGILAQSVGGGGGNGGFLVSGSFSLSGSASSNDVGGGCDVKCQAAGNGGGGGDGKFVSVDNAGSVKTMGLASIGIVAQSIGGGGGNGGFSGSGSFSGGGSGTTNAIGGSGGDGGTGGDVLVVNRLAGLVHTEQANSIGILAQSIGGGGGNGAFTIGAGVSTSGAAATTAVGGGGGKGGDAGTVTVTNDGRIETKAAMSVGIVAQSIGGGGGNGGFAVAGSLSMGSGGMDNSAGGNASGGGSSGGGTGGNAGNGNTVIVTNTGTISVAGNNSIGIVAQSIGGGGGSAGFTGQASFGGGALKNSVGASGGAGGSGGDVTVTSTGSITTGGDNSIAVLAQSIGGGGGNGALSFGLSSNGSLDSTSLQVGGTSAGAGGSMGTVTVNISGGMTQTGGALAYGMLAQAIGGGGGNGGLVIPMVKIGGDPLILVGGNGAMVNGDASNLTSSNANVVITTGVSAAGQIVQSIGGGGGVDAMAGNVAAGGVPFNLYIGGNSFNPITLTGGVHSGAGALADYTNTGTITTSGDNAIGAVIQSIGGGGGFGNYALGTVTGSANTFSTVVGGSQLAVGAGGTARSLTFGGSVGTTGLLAEGIVIQSIGGGGGIGNFVVDSGIALAGGALNMTAGGVGGAGGSGGAVTLASTAVVTTTRTGSVGIIAQSIGGGGGVAQAYGVSGTGTFTIGAAGGAAGDGGVVTLSSSQLVSTQGAGAHGILAQSIGGGGGFIQAFGAGGAPSWLPIGAGAGGGGGSGMAVGVTTTGKVTTSGDGAFGIIAQSIGGGGGVVGGGAFANTLPTSGPFAGSVGGSGTAGPVTVNAYADVMVTGNASTAVYAQSADHTGFGGNIGVTLGNATTGTTQTISGGANGATTTNAVSIVGGATNTLTNYALLTTSSGIGGMTVTGGVGNEAVANFGHMIGSVDLGTGTNSVDVKPYNSNPSTSAGVFDSGSTVNLGGPAAANLLTVEGVISPGAFLNVLTTNENGNYLQTASGSCGTFGVATSTCGYFGTDLDLKNSVADRLNATGTANVSGAVVINIDHPGEATPGTNTLTLISAAGGETHSAALALQSQPTAVATYSLVYPNATDIDLKYTIDFSPSGLTQNQHSVGTAINAIQTAHIPAFIPIAAALFYQPTVAALGNIYNSLSGEGVSAVEQTSINANDLFHRSISNQARLWFSDNEAGDPNSLISYGDAPLGYAAAGNNAFPPYNKAAKAAPVPERTWRLWTTFNGGQWKNAGDPAVVGSAVTYLTGGGFASGLDYQINPGLMVGVAAGYGQFSIFLPDRATSAGVEGTHLAAYTAARSSDTYAIATLGLDYFTNRESRFASVPGTVLPPLFGMQIPPIPGFSERDVGKFSSYSLSGLFEVGHKISLGAFNLTPLAGVQFTYLWMNGFTETNSGLPSTIGLAFPSRTIPSVPTHIGAQLDTKRYFGDGSSFYSWLRAEWVHEFEPHRTINPAFIAAPGFNFVIEGAEPAIDLARISIGGKLAFNDHAAFTANVSADLYTTLSYSALGGFRYAW